MATAHSTSTIPRIALPKETRSTVTKNLVDSLRTNYNTTTAVLCASLINDADDEPEARQSLVEVLLAHNDDSNTDSIIEVAKSAPWLGNALLRAINDELALEAAKQDSEAISTTATGATSDGPTTVRLLRCAKLLISDTAEELLLSKLMSTCLVLVRSQTRLEAFSARATIFSIMSVGDYAERSAKEVRECVTSHLLSDRALPFQQTIGFSFWLRQLSSSPSFMLSHIDGAQYWDKIALGLRHGDSERRKLCLEILKLSVQTAADHGRIDLVTSDTTVSTTALIRQYERYSTVFETLALARYQNLLLETERDLNHLASSASFVDSKWLFVLLQTALAPDMLDQNRKVVGKWILNDNLKRKPPIEELATFLKQSYLPWMAEGHLFVSTVRLDADQAWRCDHGQRVSKFVVSLIESRPENASRLLDLHLDLLLRGQSKMFLPAAAYIMDGLTRSAHHFSLNSSQLEIILQLSTWQAFADFAKAFVRRCCWTLIQSSKTSAAAIDELPEALKAQYEVLSIRYSSGSVVAAIPTSEREKKTQQALQKCVKAQDPSISSSSSELCQVFDDIWSDAEYLVYPRELLMEIPKTILSYHALQASRSEGTPEGELTTCVRTIIHHMLRLAETRSYILASLMTAVRRAVLTKPDTLHIVDLEDCILQVANSPPQPKIDLQFDYVLANLLQERFTTDTAAGHAMPNDESRGIAMYLDLVSRLKQHQDILQSIATAIIARWRRQKIPPPTISAFKTTMQLRVLVLCCEHLEELSTTATNQILDDLFFLLSIEPLPRYRFLLSWAILNLLQRSPEQHDRLSHLLNTKDHHSNPKYLAALMKLSVELASTSKITEDFAFQLASNFIALSASSKVVIRHEAQWSFPLLMDLARSNQWNKVADNQAFLSLDNYIRSLPRFDEPPADRTYARFDPVKNNTMQNLAEGLWTELDYTGPPLARRKDFTWLHEQDIKESLTLPEACIPLGDPIDGIRRSAAQPEAEQLPAGFTGKQADQMDVVALQTKGSAYLENLLRGDETVQSRQHQLIVLASLVTNPYNLGGLSRVSEIFGAQALYVRDPKVVGEKDFVSVAVSSHHHIDILPLAEQDIATFLADKKAQGWTAIGVEQTDRSDMLGMESTQLPTKTIVIIGNEREGMPGSVISECDVLIEIPQRGVTRSMNVQTVAAVVLYEFNRQHS